MQWREKESVDGFPEKVTGWVHWKFPLGLSVISPLMVDTYKHDTPKFKNLYRKAADTKWQFVPPQNPILAVSHYCFYHGYYCRKRKHTMICRKEGCHVVWWRFYIILLYIISISHLYELSVTQERDGRD